jgi:AAA+ superfamily predicted ATPase
VISKLASYLPRLPEKEYGISSLVASVINYGLDAWWQKTDERNRIDPMPWCPADPHAHVCETWLGCALYRCVSLNRTYPTWARALNAYAFWCLFEGQTAEYEIIPYLDVYEFRDMIKGSHQYRIQSEIIPIELGKQIRLPVFGNFFVQSRGTNICMFITLDLCYDSSRCTITVMTAPEHAIEAEQFLRAMDASIEANDIYYRKCLSYDRGKLDFAAVTPTLWDDIVMKPDLKVRIQQNTIGILDNTEVLSGLGMCPNRNLLMISPPGMAKTMTFRAVSCDVEGRITRIWCTGKSIGHAEHVTQLFAAARAMAPCIVFIEDMDLFGGERTASRESRVLNEFLACLDGAQENAGVVIMASTNDVVSMDEALVNRPGRFEIKIEVPLPDEADRFAMLNKFLTTYHAKHDVTVSKDTIKNVIEMTDGLTGDYVRSLAKSVVIRAVARGAPVVNETVVFSADDVIDAAQQVMQNYMIGKRAKRHHIFEAEGSHCGSFKKDPKIVKS